MGNCVGESVAAGIIHAEGPTSAIMSGLSFFGANGKHMATIRDMRADEVDAVTRVINAAFIVERFFKKGDRTTPDLIRALTGRAFLVADVPGGDPAGRSTSKSAAPASTSGCWPSILPPGTGLGRALMTAAENHRTSGCATADITVVNLRTELPPFYRKLGYIETGTEPFTRDDEIIQACHFIAMSKRL